MTIQQYRDKEQHKILTEQEKKEWEILKVVIAHHKEWLAHPVTQDFLGLLKKRSDNHTQQLFNLVLDHTDTEKESKLREVINTCKAHIKILSDSDTFVEHLQTINKQ